MNAEYNKYKELVDKHILDFLPTVDCKSSILLESIEYSVKASGKRLRPVLMLAACEMAGGNIYDALPFACAMEYIHTYSLIHDDLPAMDDDDLRRGVPTNHVEFGEGIAILAGDGLLNSAYEIMYKQTFLNFDNSEMLKKQINAAYIMAKAAGIGGMVAGQAADIECEQKKCSNEMLEYIHLNKTGALIVASIKAGLLFGNPNDELTRNMIEYAENLGLAYQIQDDVLDIEGTEDETGKRSLSDEKKHKVTYVSINGIDTSKQKLDELKNNALKSLEQYYDNAEFFNELMISLTTRSK